MYDRQQAVVQRREPAQPELPERTGELLLPRAQLGAVAVEVPPAAAVARVQKTAVRPPLDLGDGLVRSAGDRPRPRQPAVVADLGDHQLRPVPRHPRMVPAQPGGPPAVGRQPGAGDEPVPGPDEFPHGTPVVGGRPVQRHRGQDPPYVVGAVPGELLQHTPHFAAGEVHPGLRPAQTAAHRGHRGERPGLTAGLVPVEPLVGEVHEDDEGPAVVAHSAPGPAAVLDDPAAHVPGRGQHRLLAAVGPPPHQGPPAALGRPGLGPPDLVADEIHPLRPSVVRGGERRVDGRRPRSVRRSSHLVPHCLGRPQEAVQDSDPEVQRLHGHALVHAVEQRLVVEVGGQLQR